MVNERRKVSSLASLLADGYASFSKNGLRLSQCRSTDECFSPETCLFSLSLLGVHLDRFPLASDGRSAKFDSKRRRFFGSIKSDYQSDYETACYDEEDRSSSEDPGNVERESRLPSIDFLSDRPRRRNRTSSSTTTATPRRCGVPSIVSLNQRIIGGTESIPNSRPWQAYIVDGLGALICGGFLIDESHVVTAAHCLPSRIAEGVVVVLGLHSLANFSAPRAQVSGADRLFINERFMTVQQGDDIAVIRLRRAARLNDFVSPICLPGPQPGNNDPVLVTGWGITNLSKPVLSAVLNEVIVQVLNEQTSAIYGPLFNPERQIGAGGPTGVARGPCFGDSGGALAFHSAGQWFAVGIVSWGISCDTPNTTAIYARVFFYLDWIRNAISTP